MRGLLNTQVIPIETLAAVVYKDRRDLSAVHGHRQQMSGFDVWLLSYLMSHRYHAKTKLNFARPFRKMSVSAWARGECRLQHNRET